MFYNRWHPEVAIRYLPVVREIKKYKYKTVLEIGSGGLGIAPYLNRPVVGLDKNFLPPFHCKLQRITGIGSKIPFADKSFDVVICVDILEHVDKSERKKIIAEMTRVAAKEVIVAVPTGNKSLEQDKELATLIDYPFFKEHLKFGLPTVDEIMSLMGDNVRVEENESLILRDFLMRGWMTKNFPAKVFYRKILLLAIPFFKIFNSPPHYRTIFYKIL